MKGIGGGIITRKLLFAVLLISSLSLTGIASASAAEGGTVQKQSNNTIVLEEKSITKLNNTNCASQSANTQKPANQTTNINSAPNNKILESNNITDTTVVKSTATKLNNSSNTSTTIQNTEASGASVSKTAAAAGSTTSSNSVSEVKSSATTAYSTFNQAKFPATVVVGKNAMDASVFMAMEANAIAQIYYGTNNPIPVNINWKWSTAPQSGIVGKTLTKDQLVDACNRFWWYFVNNGNAPAYVNTAVGPVSLNAWYYTMTDALQFAQNKGGLPTWVGINNPPSKVAAASGTVVPNPTTDPYLQPTANCQVNDPAIKSLANSIASKYVTTYDKATAIFNWVRDNVGYSFYYNTKYGAVGTLNARTGNCVDTAHLVVALERAAGIPARYEHVNAQFSSGNWYGHVVAQVWINGVWYMADATSSYNTFGAIRNWNTNTATYYGVYQSLPF